MVAVCVFYLNSVLGAKRPALCVCAFLFKIRLRLEVPHFKVGHFKPKTDFAKFFGQLGAKCPAFLSGELRAWYH